LKKNRESMKTSESRETTVLIARKRQRNEENRLKRVRKKEL